MQYVKTFFINLAAVYGILYGMSVATSYAVENMGSVQHVDGYVITTSVAE